MTPWELCKIQSTRTYYTTYIQCAMHYHYLSDSTCFIHSPSYMVHLQLLKMF